VCFEPINSSGCAVSATFPGRSLSQGLLAKSSVAIARLNRIDFILCHGYETATLAAADIKREFGIPFGLVSHGDISDQPVGTWDPIVTRFYAAVAPPAYRAADLIIALSPRIRELALLQGARSDNVCLIPHGIDLEEVGLESRIPPPAKLGGSEPMRLLYVGGLLFVKGVDLLLDSTYGNQKWTEQLKPQSD
jgi:glycosyltransferase involved in cell wall biosynthesis